MRWRQGVLAALVFGFWAPLAEAQGFPEGSVDPATDQFTVPVADKAEADELCTAFQASTSAYPGEDTVIFAVPNDTNVDDVTCLRVEGLEDEVAEEAGVDDVDDSDDVDRRLLVGGGALLLVALGFAWPAMRDRRSAGTATKAPKRRAPKNKGPETPAGWYPEPGKVGTQRYWDGNAWTEHRAPK